MGLRWQLQPFPALIGSSGRHSERVTSSSPHRDDKLFSLALPPTDEFESPIDLQLIEVAGLNLVKLKF